MKYQKLPTIVEAEQIDVKNGIYPERVKGVYIDPMGCQHYFDVGKNTKNEHGIPGVDFELVLSLFDIRGTNVEVYDTDWIITETIIEDGFMTKNTYSMNDLNFKKYFKKIDD